MRGVCPLMDGVLSERCPMRFRQSLYRYCVIIIVGLCVISAGCGRQNADKERVSQDQAGTADFKRIVSLAPSITETLFALGIGERVVGVTRFCNYPPAAKAKESVGGYLDPNYEKMATLYPDIVFLLPEHEDVRAYLDQLGIRHETVHNRTVDEILETIHTIGVLCNAETAADSLIASIDMRMQAVHGRHASSSPRSILISIGRTMGTGTLQDIYVAGTGTFYDELIGLSGGVNAYRDTKTAYPLLSAEGLMHVNPDVIIDLVPDFDAKGFSKASLLSEWYSVGHVNAVRDSSVYLLTGDYAVIPGPRFINFMEDIAAIIHTKAVRQ